VKYRDLQEGDLVTFVYDDGSSVRWLILGSESRSLFTILGAPRSPGWVQDCSARAQIIDILIITDRTKEAVSWEVTADRQLINPRSLVPAAVVKVTRKGELLCLTNEGRDGMFS